ncbi:hypothetical protein BCR44DRAFT_1440136 [Catenaria anguillulae PL171]|uniref:Uncharacterized protein n=1 Tax=Catenaria anguillulae PL171 TaxID=765915 RepID=A0A1Y2H7M4_9FUNG|nr:hypothetical protein BCR44DRAFT_1446920 [Catenaria anguillulae PL171]ORZ32568.1 hypothetical protein BCR44DRAFT_1440136 [Catenaria anguillulae PL171]
MTMTVYSCWRLQSCVPPITWRMREAADEAKHAAWPAGVTRHRQRIGRKASRQRLGHRRRAGW